MVNNPDTTPGSWVVLDETNKPICEIFSKKEAEIVNRKKKYKAVPAGEYLADLNKRIKEGRP